MLTHLIQSHDLFGPPARQDELRYVWEKNEWMFDSYTHPEGRATFTELFAMCKPGVINILANSDIFTNRKALALMEVYYMADLEARASHCMALSRYDVLPDGTTKLWAHADSADTWVFYGVPPVMDIPWTMGMPGIDNRVAYELRNAGLTVINPSKTIQTFHQHQVQWRSYLVDPEGRPRTNDTIWRVPGPYAMVHPSEL